MLKAILLAVLVLLPASTALADAPERRATTETAECQAARKAVRFYVGHISTLMRAQGERFRVRARIQGCPRYHAKVMRQKAVAARKAYRQWIAERTLRSRPDWQWSVHEVQRAYPGTERWLLSCSASEGGHGRWKPNNQGSGVGGWMQFMPGTFTRMFWAAKADVEGRGFIVPSSAASWYSPLGQALAGAWGVTHGRSHEWAGAGC